MSIQGAPNPYNGYKQAYNLDVQNTGSVLTGTVVGGWHWSNKGAALRYLKFYDKATAPASTDTPVFVLELPASTAGSLLSAVPIGVFVNGIGYRATTGSADSDNTGPTAGDVKLSLFYK